MNDQDESNTYVEALLTWRDTGPSATVTQWLERNGLNTVPTETGLLISGSRRQFERAFDVDLRDLGSSPIRLPEPAELKPWVASIVIPTWPTIH